MGGRAGSQAGGWAGGWVGGWEVRGWWVAPGFTGSRITSVPCGIAGNAAPVDLDPRAAVVCSLDDAALAE